MRIYVKSTNVYSYHTGVYVVIFKFYIISRGGEGEHTGRGQCFKVNKCTTLITRARYLRDLLLLLLMGSLTHTAPQTVTEVHTLI